MDRMKKQIIRQLEKPVPPWSLDDIYWQIDQLSYEEICALHNTFWSEDESVSSYTYGTTDEWALRAVRSYVHKRKTRLEGGNKSLKSLLAEFKREPDEDRAYELERRFEHLTMSEQKRVILTLLDSEYRYVAYNLIDDEWAQILLHQLERDWLEHSYVAPTLYFIKYSSRRFLLKHLDKIEFLTGYYNKLCLRLKDCRKFKVKREYFHDKWDYYTTMCMMGKEVTRKEVLMELYATIKKALLHPSESFKEIARERYIPEIYNPRNVTAQLIPEVREALRAMKDAGMNDEVKSFLMWDRSVRTVVKTYIDHRKPYGSNELSLRDMWDLYCKLAKSEFPDPTSFSRDVDRSERLKEEYCDAFEALGLTVVRDPFDNFPMPRLSFHKPRLEPIIPSFLLE